MTWCKQFPGNPVGIGGIGNCGPGKLGSWSSPGSDGGSPRKGAKIRCGFIILDFVNGYRKFVIAFFKRVPDEFGVNYLANTLRSHFLR